MPKANPINMLKQDHQKVKALLEELSETNERSTKKRIEMLEQIALELKVHMRIEEELFYPAYKEAVKSKDDKKMYYESTEEHRAADMVLKDLLKADPSSLNFAGKVKVLKDLIEHHVGEEEKEMFPNAKKAMDAEELQTLGEQMTERKEELLASGKLEVKATPKKSAAKSGRTQRSASRQLSAH